MTVTIVVTVLTERGGSEQLLMALQEELTQLGDILPDVTIDSGAVGRFGECYCYQLYKYIFRASQSSNYSLNYM